MSETVKVILGVGLVAALLVGNFLLGPSNYIPVGEEPIPVEAQIDGRKQLVPAELAWEHKGLRIYGFWLFPTSRQLVLHNKEHGIKWELKDDYRERREAELAPTHPVALWRFFLGPLSVVIGVVLFWLGGVLDRTIVDLRTWSAARTTDTFRSYKDYIVEKRKPKLFESRARSAMMGKIGAYRSFYAALTADSEGRPRDALLQILEHIAQTGELDLGVLFEFDNRLLERKELLRLETDRLATVLKAPESEVPIEQRAAAAQARAQFQRELGYDLVLVKPTFTGKHNTSREKLLTNLLDRVFSRIFPERILVLRWKDRKPSAQLRIRYAVSNTASLFSSSSEAHLSMDKRKTYTGIRFDWDVSLNLADEELLRRNLRSEPASSFRTSGSDATAVYKAMAMSAFVDMGKTLLHEFGVQRAAGLPAPAGGSPMLLSELFEQFSEEVVDAAFGVAEVSSTAARAFFDGHRQEISDLMGSLAGDLDRMMDLYVNGLARSIDLADLAFEAIAGMLGDS